MMEGVRGLSGDGGGDVGLLAPMTSISLGYHVLLGLEEGMAERLDVNSMNSLTFFQWILKTLHGKRHSFKYYS